MKKINIRENFFKDVVFNLYTHKKYLLIDKLCLIGGILLNAISFFLYSITGNVLFHEVDYYMRIINALLISGVLAIHHRVNINNLNFSRDMMDIEANYLFSPSISSIEIIPKNFDFNEDVPLGSLKKIYKEGAYVIIKTYSKEYILYAKNDDVFIVENEDEIIEEIKTLRLSR